MSSQVDQSPAPATTPYAQYVVRLYMAAIPFWLLAIYYIYRSTRGAHFLPEELGALAVAVTGTLASALVWCADLIYRNATVPRIVVTRPEPCQHRPRGIGTIIRSAAAFGHPVMPAAGPSDDETAKIPTLAVFGSDERAPAAAVAQAFDMGRRIGRRDRAGLLDPVSRA